MSSLLALRDLVHRSGGQGLVPTPDPEGGEAGHIHPEAVVPGVLVIEVEGLTFQLEGDLSPTFFDDIVCPCLTGMLCPL